MLSLYNTLTRSQDDFVPLKPGCVGMYVCGPTVYGRASIGNLRSYVFADTLRRLFEVEGYKVTHVMNITDVGHLVSDGDDGEDKLEKGSRREGKSAWDVAKQYTDLFVADLGKLNIELPHVMPRATDHIAEQIAFIQAIEEKGLAYRISDGIYFDTAKLPSYGRLSGQSLAEKAEGARVEVNTEKRNPSDFALWKFSDVPAQDPEHSEGSFPSLCSGQALSSGSSRPRRQMEWESPWGVGFPGWHIECSAMGEKYLGVPFDIHTGGIDHIAVHHENELAQTDAARGCLEANVWMHNEFLLVDGGKMSKSLNNTYSLDDLAEKGIAPRAFRLFLLGAHYRSHLNFTFEAAQASQNAINNLIDAAREWAKPGDLAPDEASMRAFLACVANDLDTAGALAVFWDVVRSEALPSGVKAATVLKMDEVLGLALEDVVARPIKITDEAQKLLDERARARAAKEWAKSDELRDALAEMGYVVEDTGGGQRVREGR